MKFQSVKLGKLCKIQSGGTPRRGVEGFYGGNILWAKIGDIENAQNGYIQNTVETITPAGLKSINNKVLPKNTVLLAMYGSVGKTSITGLEMTTNQAILGLQPNNQDVLHFRYLKYWLDCSKKDLIKKARGVALQNISATIVKEFEIPLPPLEDQKRIVKILDDADTLRQKRKQAIKLLDDYLKSIFLDMFGDPVENPKGFSMQPLNSLLTTPTKSGLYVPREKYSCNGVEMVHMSDVFYGVVPRGKLKRVDISEKEIKKYSISSTDILIARRSLTYEGSARPCRIPVSSEMLIFESSLIKVTPDNNRLLPLYLYFYLSSDRVRSAYVLKHVTSSTISGINQSGLNKVMVLLPPIELQKSFINFVKKQELIKQEMLTQSAELETQFQALMQKAFKGEL